MTNSKSKAIKPGEIRLDLISSDWPLTPLGSNKDPYISSWQNNPFNVHDIEEEIIEGRCKAIGLLSGPVYNLPYGFVWVDIDGPSIYSLIENLSDNEFEKALPKTLTI